MKNILDFNPDNIGSRFSCPTYNNLKIYFLRSGGDFRFAAANYELRFTKTISLSPKTGAINRKS